jgi:hypothetical protein
MWGESIWKSLWRQIRPSVLMAAVITEVVMGMSGLMVLIVTGHFVWAGLVLFFGTLLADFLIQAISKG